MKYFKKDFLSYEKRLDNKILRTLVRRIVSHMYFFFIYNCVGKNLVARDLFVYVRSTKQLLYILTSSIVNNN